MAVINGSVKSEHLVSEAIVLPIDPLLLDASPLKLSLAEKSASRSYLEDILSSSLDLYI